VQSLFWDEQTSLSQGLHPRHQQVEHNASHRYYANYQLVPRLPQVPSGMDTLPFLVPQALDIGGMCLLNMTRRAGLPKTSLPVQVGVRLVVLMILNMVLTTVKEAREEPPRCG
jgi:hypothetical protein